MIGVFSKNVALFAPNVWHKVYALHLDGEHVTAYLSQAAPKGVWSFPVKLGAGLSSWKTNTSPIPHFPLILPINGVEKYKKWNDASVWFDFDNKKFVFNDGVTCHLNTLKIHLAQYKVKPTTTKLNNLLQASSEDILATIEAWHIIADKAAKTAQLNPTKSLWEDIETLAATDPQAVPYKFTETLLKAYKPAPPTYSWILKGGVVVRPEPLKDPEVPF